jgi:hypothetical protein
VHLKENNEQHSKMKKVAELLLCLPGSNASTERVFTCMNYIWPEEKSRFHVDTIQAIIAVKTNINLSCEAFSEKLASNPGVLKKIHSSDKFQPSQGPPIQSNQGTVEIIILYYIITFIVSVRRLVRYLSLPLYRYIIY